MGRGATPPLVFDLVAMPPIPFGVPRKRGQAGTEVPAKPTKSKPQNNIDCLASRFIEPSRQSLQLCQIHR